MRPHLVPVYTWYIVSGLREHSHPPCRPGAPRREHPVPVAEPVGAGALLVLALYDTAALGRED
jgi:hypothetical protein